MTSPPDEPAPLTRDPATDHPGSAPQDGDGAGPVEEGGASGRGRKRAHHPKSATRNLVEWVVVVVGAVLVAVVIRTFVFQTFWIPSPSMATTLVKDDRVIVNKLSYRAHDVNRGDVIVFERPPGETDSTIKDLIKRVVGLPGEHVRLVNGTVQIDGRTLDEPYTHDLPTLQCGSAYPELTTSEGLLVPEGHVLVMGDNRTNSHDGRCFGPIDEDLIVGRAFFIIWPPSKIGGL